MPEYGSPPISRRFPASIDCYLYACGVCPYPKQADAAAPHLRRGSLYIPLEIGKM